ncbi:MAG: hypothetical protein LUH36_04500 [Oscillospiraceae bacterium]|nr:hypothetical protein [Oscillospiraceae bacterium]
MKFYPLTGIQDNTDPKELASEYEAAREIGKLRLGELRLYFKQARKIYYIPYNAVRRCFRRVQLVQAKLCCGKGNLEIENLVICGEEGELAQVQLPGTKAAKVLMTELERLIPEAEFGKPAEAPGGNAGEAAKKS